MTTDRLWILRAGVNDDVCGTFSSREKAEKQGSFLQHCGELSTYTVVEYVLSSELEEATKREAKLREALKAVVDGNDLAAERGQRMDSWNGSVIRRQARAALAGPQ